MNIADEIAIVKKYNSYGKSIFDFYSAKKEYIMSIKFSKKLKSSEEETAFCIQNMSTIFDPKDDEFIVLHTKINSSHATKVYGYLYVKNSECLNIFKIDKIEMNTVTLSYDKDEGIDAVISREEFNILCEKLKKHNIPGDVDAWALLAELDL